jgi:hypothetical protein
MNGGTLPPKSRKALHGGSASRPIYCEYGYTKCNRTSRLRCRLQPSPGPGLSAKEVDLRVAVNLCDMSLSLRHTNSVLRSAHARPATWWEVRRPLLRLGLALGARRRMRNFIFRLYCVPRLDTVQRGPNCSRIVAEVVPLIGNSDSSAPVKQLMLKIPDVDGRSPFIHDRCSNF